MILTIKRKKNNKEYKVLIDECDFERVSQFKWYIYDYKGCLSVHNWKSEPMHDLILQGEKNKKYVIHKNWNNLDDRRENLLSCDSRTVHGTQKVSIRSKSGLKGVFWYEAKGKWRAVIQINGRKKHLGSFETKKEAASAYNIAAIKLFGSNCKLNNI